MQIVCLAQNGGAVCEGDTVRLADETLTVVKGKGTEGLIEHTGGFIPAFKIREVVVRSNGRPAYAVVISFEGCPIHAVEVPDRQDGRSDMTLKDWCDLQKVNPERYTASTVPLTQSR